MCFLFITASADIIIDTIRPHTIIFSRYRAPRTDT